MKRLLVTATGLALVVGIAIGSAVSCGEEEEATETPTATSEAATTPQPSPEAEGATTPQTAVAAQATAAVEPTPGQEEEYERWETYSNEIFGYTLKYPGDALIGGGKPGRTIPPSAEPRTIQFVGPLVENCRWPYLQVNHPDADFFHPPSGTDVKEWILDSNLPYDEMDTELQVAGLPTVHLVQEKSPQANATDWYYFIKGDQLFEIQIIHTCERQDWDLYNKFLKSFSFE